MVTTQVLVWEFYFKNDKLRAKLFKSYCQEQLLHLPVQISSLIPENHLVRIVDRVVEGIDMSVLEAFYVGGGCSPYHPKMMIKLWIYGYCERYYTSRRLAKAIRENIHYMWLSGHHQPCFKTLNNFRSGKLSEMIDIVFKEVLEMLVELGYIDLDDLYVDGSKWEANGNRHKVVWRKNTERYKGIVIKLSKYEAQELILGTRNSYNRTDEDATMLRMKDEQLLAAYNVQPVISILSTIP